MLWDDERHKKNSHHPLISAQPSYRSERFRLVLSHTVLEVLCISFAFTDISYKLNLFFECCSPKREPWPAVTQIRLLHDIKSDTAPPNSSTKSNQLIVLSEIRILKSFCNSARSLKHNFRSSKPRNINVTECVSLIVRPLTFLGLSLFSLCNRCCFLGWPGLRPSDHLTERTVWMQLK